MRVLRGRFPRSSPAGEDPARTIADLTADLRSLIEDLEGFQETWRSPGGLRIPPATGNRTRAIDGRDIHMAEARDKTTREVCEDLGIESVDLMKLYRGDRDRIPVRRTGIGYLWSPEAVAVVRQMLADQSDKKAALRQTEEAENYFAALAQLHRTGEDFRRLGESLLGVYRSLMKNPPTATGFIHSLPDPDLRLVHPLAVLLSPTDRKRWRASLAEAGLEALGETREKAIVELRALLVRTYRRLRAAPKSDTALWQTLGQLIGPRQSVPWPSRQRE